MYNPIIFIFALIFYAAFAISKFSLDFWFISWAKRSYSDMDNLDYGLIGGLLIIIMLVVTVFRAVAHSLGSKIFCYNLNFYFMKGIMMRTMAFFDKTPSGVIINRATKDIFEADLSLPNFMSHMIFNTFYIAGIFILVGLSSPFMIIVIAILLMIFAKFTYDFSIIFTDLQKVGSLSVSPLLSNLGEFVQGNIIIKRYNRTEYMKDIFFKNLEISQNAQLHNILLFSFFSMKLDIIISFVTLVIGLAISLSKIFDILFYSKEMFALTITSILGLSDFIAFTLYTFVTISSSLSNIERVIEFFDPKEEDRERDSHKLEKPKNWPMEGHIVARNISMRYRKDLPRVLNNLSFDIKPKEKIGVVGRTGSGKSSLILNLLRLVELDCDPKSRE